MPWLTKSYRISVFLPQGRELQIPNWHELFGTEPDTQVKKAGTSFEEGPFGKGRLRVGRQEVNDRRIDFFYGAFAPVAEPGPPSLGAEHEAFEIVRPHVVRALERVPRILRLATAVEHLEPVNESLDRGVELLGMRIDRKRFDLRDVRDFIYQINRRRPSRVVENLIINRIAHWELAGWQVVSVGAPDGQVSSIEEVLAVVLNTDINTDASFGDFPGERASDLLAELASLDMEIAANGDV